MNEIVKEIERISEKLVEIEQKFDLRKNENMNLLWWKWHEERRGLIKAAAYLGVTVECVDLSGTKLAAKVVKV